MLVVLHVHTNVSACSESPVEEIAEYCRTQEIEAIAITDHNELEGAWRLQAVAPWLKVIAGEEVSTREGEVIGLFLHDRIDPAQPLRDTCEQIKSQGGLVYVPHPMDKFKIHRVHTEHLMDIVDMVDIIEVYNAKASLAIYNRSAKKLAQQLGKVAAVGSDSHYVKSIGSAVNIMDPFGGPQDFLEKLAHAKFRKGVASLFATWWVRARKLAGMSI